MPPRGSERSGIPIFNPASLGLKAPLGERVSGATRGHSHGRVAASIL